MTTNTNKTSATDRAETLRTRVDALKAELVAAEWDLARALDEADAAEKEEE